jgi:hypothetical protein
MKKVAYSSSVENLGEQVFAGISDRFPRSRSLSLSETSRRASLVRRTDWRTDSDKSLVDKGVEAVGELRQHHSRRTLVASQRRSSITFRCPPTTGVLSRLTAGPLPGLLTKWPLSAALLRLDLEPGLMARCG